MAAFSLLEPEVRASAGISRFEGFQYKEITTYWYENNQTPEDRPLASLPGHPAFLETAARQLTRADAESAPVFMLLLAQYGQFDALDRMLAQPQPSDTKKRAFENEAQNALFAAIGLSHNVKYVPYLLNMARTTQAPFEWQAILKAARGMNGREARQLRMEVNKQMRQTGGGGSVNFQTE